MKFNERSSNLHCAVSYLAEILPTDRARIQILGLSAHLRAACIQPGIQHVETPQRILPHRPRLLRDGAQNEALAAPLAESTPSLRSYADCLDLPVARLSDGSLIEVGCRSTG